MIDQPSIEFYLRHLAELNKSKAVTLTRNIVDKHQKTLLACGTALNEMAIATLKQSGCLTYSTQSAIQLEEEITGEKLLNQLLSFASDYPDILTIFEKEALSMPLGRLVSAYQAKPLLVQNLTILSHREPNLFHKACLCTLIGVALAQELHLTPNLTRTLFYATLMQDIGMLYISPELPHKPLKTAADWRAKNQHIVLGAQLLSEIPDIPKEACIALLECHERCDGSGFPSAKSLGELSDTGQIVALLAKLYKIRFEFFNGTGQTLNESLPILLMNNQTYKHKHFIAVNHLIRKSCIAKVNLVTPKTIPIFIKDLIKNIKCIGVWYRLTLDLDKIIPNMADHILFTALHNRIMTIKFTVEKSGILSECMVRWIEYLEASLLETGFREVEEMSVMLLEITDQLHDVSKHINYILTDRKTLALVASKSNKLEQINAECQECALGQIPKSWESQAQTIEQIFI